MLKWLERLRRGPSEADRELAAQLDEQLLRVSLLIAERRSIVDVARQAGHSPSMALNTYGHVFDELEDAEPASAEELIREARATLVRPSRHDVGSQANENSA